jgi:uncharacterized protein YcfJ
MLAMHGRKKFAARTALAAALAAAAGCQSMNHAERGTAMGGALGAAAGAMIGDASNGKAGKGALIGGAAGAIAGGLLGASEDKHEAAAERDAQRQHALSLQEVVQMTQQGLSDDIICNQIRTGGYPARLSASDLSYLKQQQVSDRVVMELQRHAGRPVLVQAPGPVIVERPVYFAPPPPVILGPPAVGVGFHYMRRR